MSKLLHIYLNYGLTLKKNIILHKYWYSCNKQLINAPIIKRNKKLFRHYHYNNPTLNFEHSYSIRLSSGEYFPMKTIYLRYRYWYIICVHWFKPIKKKISKLQKFSKYSPKKPVILTLWNLSKINFLKRIKLLIYLFLKEHKKTTNYSF